MKLNDNIFIKLLIDSNNKWSSERPICRSIRCNPKQTKLEFGEVHCTNYNVVGSICKLVS